MVTQRHRQTKLFSTVLSLAVMLGLAGFSLPAWGIIPMDKQSIDAALVYGMKNQKASLSTLLGPNWIENEDGALLNVYTPFMVLATKASKGGFPSNPAKSDLQAARKKYGKYVAFYGDPKNRLEVKFAVSFYGNSPSFAKSYEARIEGFGRGKEFNLKPVKRYLDQIADPVKNGLTQGQYEAVNSYYFNFKDIANLEEFKLIMESPTGPPISFRIRTAQLY
jgi:hypothetical protein